MPTKFHLRAALVRTYINWAFLCLLLKNAAISAFTTVVLVYLKGGTPNYNLLGLLYVAAFVWSIFEQVGGAKAIAILQAVLQILQQLIQQQQSAKQSIADKDTASYDVPPRASLQRPDLDRPPYTVN